MQEGAFAFYRYHVPDPVYFYEDIKVSIQQIGGAPKQRVGELVRKGAELIPVSVDHPPQFTRLLDLHPAPELEDEKFPEGWTNFCRSDDVSATAYFYLDRAEGTSSDLPSPEVRTANLTGK